MATNRTLETVYSEALVRYERLHEDGAITDSQLQMLKSQKSLNNVICSIQSAEKKGLEERTLVDHLCRKVSPEIVSRVDRFSAVLDSAIGSGEWGILSFPMGKDIGTDLD
jgi:hypothetical protein